jgi:tetratricopeptide (TPR) repeat protein
MFAPGKIALVLLTVALLAIPCAAQQETDIVVRPVRPLDRRELDRREALLLFGQAAEHEHRNRLSEALKTYEKALRLDPDAAPVLRALVPLYQALDRQQESLDACKRIVELDPEDHDTWHTYASQLRAIDRDADACKALLRAVACKGLKELPEAHLSTLQDLGAVQTKLNDIKGAETTFREVIALLERPAAAQDLGGLSKDELTAQIADTYERVGRLCIRAEQTDRAVEAFKNAQSSDPARVARLSYNLAEVLAAQKRDAEALHYTDLYLARQPQGIEGYELKLKLLRRLGRENEVVAALERHSRIDPYHNALKLLLAREYQSAGRLGDAERIYLALLASPQVEVYRGLFNLYRLEGKRGAEKLFDRLDRAIAAANPDDKEKKAIGDAAQAAHGRAMLAALREDRELVGALLPVALDRILKGPKPAYKTRVFVAVLAERTGQLDTAEKCYRSCLDSEGRVVDFGPRGQNESEVYGGLLRVLYLGRQHQAIVELCKQGLEHAEATNRVMFHLDNSTALLALGRAKEALEAGRAAVDTAGADHRRVCRCRLAALLAQVGQFKEAEAECMSMLKDFKEDEDVREIRFTLSAVYSQAKEAEKSEEQLKIILKDDPLDAHANNDLGYLWADRNKNLDEAERMIRKALDLDRQQRNTKDALSLDADRDNAAYIDSLGWVLFRRGKYREAREQLEKATRLPEGAHDPVVWDHLGDALFRMKDSKKAAEAWRRSLTLFEEGQRKGTDDRYKDIEQKLKQAEATP